MGALRLAALVGLAVVAAVPVGPSRPDSVRAENAKQGSRAWRVALARPHAVEGYASSVSVGPGDELSLHVSTTPAARYRVEIYRLGWYGGTGGRLLACVPAGCTGSEAGTPRPIPAPAADGYLDAGWPVTDALRVPASWVSGYYLAVLRLTSGSDAGRGNWVPFVVRAGPGTHSAILVQAAVNTWQAYNRWGGMSLYKGPSGASCAGICTRVSFDRPYDPTTQNYSQYELPLVHFLEQHGYDVSYTTDVDTDRDPAELLRHRLVIVAGHDEYWTKSMRDGFDIARRHGTNLAFVGANTGYWQMRYSDRRRTIVEYRTRRLDPERNPALQTVRFRNLVPPRPECELEGVQYVGSGSESIGGQHDYDLAAGALSDPWFAGTGFAPGSVLAGIVGYEWDAVTPGCPTPPLHGLFHFAGPPAPADGVRFTAPSGARVFSAGSLSFARGLDEFRPHPRSRPTGDARLESFMANVLADLQRPEQPLSVTTARAPGGVSIAVRRAPDPRIEDVRIYRAPAVRPLARGSRGMHLVCRTIRDRCLDQTAPPATAVRYVVVLRDRWGTSAPFVTDPVAAVRQRAGGRSGRATGPTAAPMRR